MVGTRNANRGMITLIVLSALGASSGIAIAITHC